MPPQVSLIQTDASEISVGLRSRARRADSSGQFTVEEVKRHNTPKDCWVIIHEKVYDVTEFFPMHPGGQVLLTAAGGDATEVFSAFHSTHAFGMLKEYMIGSVTDLQPPEVIREFRALRASLQKQRMFESSKLYYAYKILSNLSIVGMGIYLIWSSSFLPIQLLGAFLIAVFFQQSGWLAHDFLHHQVFHSRFLNNCVGLFLGNFCQGFSVHWWKLKHNTHHAVPNIIDHDPDIDTLPFLAWSRKLLCRLQNPLSRFLVRNQVFLYVPLLSFARVLWATESFVASWYELFVPPKEYHIGYRIAEAVLVTLHWAWFITALSILGPLKGFLFGWFITAIAGLFLASVFVISHNGMEILDEQLDFVHTQMYTTRDVTPNLFNNWFTGGLNYQIEHHLFPTMPRHNFRRARKQIKAFCDKHKIPFLECGFIEGSLELFRHLHDVSDGLQELKN
mmetsp:Transcript_43983/g.71559  ORF Transcript_43983/g.71559 Transcript_43983/m.71559 type:complete len:449 (+) Transcript_43983:188-1534(+)|eukprot:CAMPEP_0184655950 /NCGR_PEP_ID=MMETSP0308-20130426/15014_1 /TAXON_ID=38269 /ORGANISM="Gloeochaete witrockiana, Strain SAG 46.84" /LENGTH=448 /DNA_ID=CAMNT_0027092781 /DNA_START=186 /DNA_END=1532 /DNA_ORIENTATION=+